jgi:hypothetical protein
MSLYNIWTDDDYVYTATTSGLDIVSIETEQSYAFISDASGYTAVWASDTDVYLGTSDSGAKILSKSDIDPTVGTSDIRTFLTTPDLTSNNVRYIHGNENIMSVTTDAGISIYNLHTEFTSSRQQTGVGKCFVPAAYNYVYYIVSDTYIHRVLDRVGNWVSSDAIYTANVGFLEGTTEIKDIYVNAHNSLSGNDNTLFIATDVGIYILDEDSGTAVRYTTVTE